MTAAPKPDIPRDPGYLTWLRFQRCVICHLLGLVQKTSSDPAHTPRVRIHGDIAVSLCRFHHTEEECLQPTAFWGKYGLDPLVVYMRQHAQFDVETNAVAW